MVSSQEINFSTVRVYGKPMCQMCRMTEKWLDSRGVDYDKVDLTQSPDDFAAVTALGYKVAPVIMVADDVHWGGFRPDLLELHFGKKAA